MQRAPLLSALITLSTLAGTAVAHHSGAMFDRSKVIVLEGTVVEYKFVAPHSWISVMAQVNGKGEKARWDVESATASRMKLQGVTPKNLKPGDKITMVVSPMRDGRKGAALLELTLADGTKMRNDTTKLKVGQ